MKKPPLRLVLFCFLAAFPSFALFAADEPNKDKPNESGAVIERAPEQGQTTSDEEVAALRTENKRLTAELDEVRRDAESLRSDLSAATASKERDAVSRDENAREIASLRAKLAQLASSSGAKNTPDPDLEKKLASMQNELAAARSAAEANAAKAEAEKKRADEATTRLSTIVPGVDQLTAAKSGLEAELANSRNTEASLRQQLAAAEQAVSRATAAAPQLAELTAKLTDTENKLAATARSYSLAQAENELLKTASAENAKLTAEVQTLRQEKAALEARANAAPNTDLAGKLAETEDKLSTTLRSFSQLQAENEKLKTDAAHANEALENLRKEKSDLETRANAAPPNPGNSDLAGKLAAAEDKLSTTLHSFSQLQAENENLKADVARAHEKAQAAATELENVQKEKSALEAHAPSASPASENSSDLAAKLASTEDKLSTVLRSYTLLQAENDRIKADAARAEENAQASSAKSTGEATARASTLFDELRQTQARAAVLAEENSQLKTRLALVGSPPGSTLASPVRPGTAAAEAAVASAAATQNPSPSPAAGRTHVVVAGDSLTKISRQYYGTPSRWDEILRANRDVIKNENVLPVGATLHIP